MATMKTICPFCFNKVTLTDSYLCPKCNEELPRSIAQTENLLFSIIGVVSSGKTNYITVMLEEFKNASHHLKLSLSDQGHQYTGTIKRRITNGSMKIIQNLNEHHL
jgi:hypothetical protein